jgi:hypothetical protein
MLLVIDVLVDFLVPGGRLIASSPLGRLARLSKRSARLVTRSYGRTVPRHPHGHLFRTPSPRAVALG